MSLGIYLLAMSLYSLGMFVFFLLFNLYLLDLGWEESFLGVMSGLMTAGSIVGSLPAGWLASRIGLLATVRAAIAGAVVISALRAWVSGRWELLGLAFLGGIFGSLWAVSTAPVVAQCSPEQNRPRAFSQLFALGIGMGILGGLAGGKLPAWVGRATAAKSKQVALWIGCGVAGLAQAPLLGLPSNASASPSPGRRSYPRTPFVKRFLLATAAWNLFVGAFPPFFNTYMARRFAAGPAEIGLAFSGAQLAQMGALLSAPLLFARIGLVQGIAATQAAAALLLGLLALARTMIPAALVYAAYMALQWMNEPGWHSLLMNQVSKEEQSGASAMNFFVIFAAQAASAALFGVGVSRWGYTAVLLSTAALGLLACGVFLRLLSEATEATSSQT